MQEEKRLVQEREDMELAMRLASEQQPASTQPSGRKELSAAQPEQRLAATPPSVPQALDKVGSDCLPGHVQLCMRLVCT